MPVRRSVVRMLWPSVRQAIITIFCSRDSSFMKLILHLKGWLRAKLEIQPCKAYIVQMVIRNGLIPGVIDRGRQGCNRGGPTRLMVEAVRFELTGPCEGLGCPKVRREVSPVR